MSESAAPAATMPKPKKSVALSGVVAGNTALCTVGRTGNDLHYRGYDILDIADVCEFEEIAYLLVHGKLPNAAELAGYKAKLMSLRGLPAPVKAALEALPGAHIDRMDALLLGPTGAAAPRSRSRRVEGGETHGVDCPAPVSHRGPDPDLFRPADLRRPASLPAGLAPATQKLVRGALAGHRSVDLVSQSLQIQSREQVFAAS